MEEIHLLTKRRIMYNIDSHQQSIVSGLDAVSQTSMYRHYVEHQQKRACCEEGPMCLDLHLLQSHSQSHWCQQ